jgi:zinc transporter ZupT
VPVTGVVVFGVITFCSTLSGGLTSLRLGHRMDWLMALAGGVVLSAALSELLPEAIEQARDQHVNPQVPFAGALLGYLAFHALERWAIEHHHHDDEPSAVGKAGAATFILHSTFDGIAIGLGFQIDSALGAIVAVAVVGHDFFDGVNTVAFLRGHHHSVETSRRWLLADAIAPAVGAVVGYTAGIPHEVFPIALGFFSGVFVYVAATNLLPKARTLAASRAVPVTVLGAVAMFAITRAA